MALTEISLITVITTLTSLIVYIGIQLIKILKQLQQSIDKINQILDNAQDISNSIAAPFTGNLSFLNSLKEGLLAFSAIINFFKKQKKLDS